MFVEYKRMWSVSSTLQWLQQLSCSIDLLAKYCFAVAAKTLKIYKITVPSITLSSDQLKKLRLSEDSYIFNSLQTSASYTTYSEAKKI